MIDTSIVRVHQHGACIIQNTTQSMGRSRGGLTSKAPFGVGASSNHRCVDARTRSHRPSIR
jgi:hypothetical protein